MATRFEQDDALTEAEQRLERLRVALAEAKRAIRDSEAALDDAQKNRGVLSGLPA